MKKKTSLKSFLKSVKDDLRSAINDRDPSFTIDGVEVEVDLGQDGKVKAQKTHRVKIHMTACATTVAAPVAKARVTAKKTASKKTVAKKVVAKKPAAKKTVGKKVPARG